MREFVTSGEISRILGCPLHVVTYALTRSQIEEDARVGTYRLYRRERIPEIVAAVGSVNRPGSCVATESAQDAKGNA